MTDRWRRSAMVFAGSVVGTALRAALGLLSGPPGTWPWGTLLANLSGALLLGVLLSRLRPPEGSTEIIALLGTGLLGGFTTFSAFAEESRALIAASRGTLAFIYVAASVVGGLAAAYAGTRLARTRP